MLDIKIKEAYDTLKEVVADVSRMVCPIFCWKGRQLINRYHKGIGAINPLLHRQCN